MLVGGWQDLWDQNGGGAGGAELELEEGGSGQSEGPNAVECVPWQRVLETRCSPKGRERHEQSCLHCARHLAQGTPPPT